MDDATKALYVEKDGKYVLDLDDDDVRKHPSVVKLNSSLSNERQQRAKDKAKIAALEEKLSAYPDDFDPAEIEELKALKARLQDEDDDDSEDGKKGKRDKLASMTVLHEQKIANIAKKTAAEMAKKDAKIVALENKIRRVMIEQGLTKALVEAGIRPEFMDAAMAMLQRRAIVEMDDDEDPVAMIKTDEGDIPLEKYVPDWAASDQGKVFVAPPKGGDANGSDSKRKAQERGPNPWKDESYNLTQQSRIFKENKPLAEKLAKEAGKPVHPGGQVAA